MACIWRISQFDRNMEEFKQQEMSSPSLFYQDTDEVEDMQELEDAIMFPMAPPPNPPSRPPPPISDTYILKYQRNQTLPASTVHHMYLVALEDANRTVEIMSLQFAYPPVVSESRHSQVTNRIHQAIADPTCRARWLHADWVNLTSPHIDLRNSLYKTACESACKMCVECSRRLYSFPDPYV